MFLADRINAPFDLDGRLLQIYVEDRVGLRHGNAKQVQAHRDRDALGDSERAFADATIRNGRADDTALVVLAVNEVPLGQQCRVTKIGKRVDDVDIRSGRYLINVIFVALELRDARA